MRDLNLFVTFSWLNVLCLKQMTGKFSAQIMFINYQLGKLGHGSAMTMIQLCRHSFLIHLIFYFIDNMTNIKDKGATVKPVLLASPGSSKERAKVQKRKD